MPLRKTLYVVCLIISVFCLAAGYWIARQWIGAILAILMAPAWLLGRKYPASRLPLLCLLVSVGLAVAGILSGSPPLWMLCGSAVALALWDLLLLDAALGNKSALEPTRQYENRHLESLALALGFGLSAALLGRLLNIHIPFIVLVLCILLVLIALDRVWGYLKKTGIR
jgi:hypothetical protein